MVAISGQLIAPPVKSADGKRANGRMAQLSKFVIVTGRLAEHPYNFGQPAGAVPVLQHQMGPDFCRATRDLLPPATISFHVACVQARAVLREICRHREEIKIGRRPIKDQQDDVQNEYWRECAPAGSSSFFRPLSLIPGWQPQCHTGPRRLSR